MNTLIEEYGFLICLEGLNHHLNDKLRLLKKDKKNMQTTIHIEWLIDLLNSFHSSSTSITLLKDELVKVNGKKKYFTCKNLMDENIKW